MTEGSTTGTTGTEGRLEIRRTILRPPETVFDAWTDEEGMRRWMRPGPTESVETELDVRVGGSYTITMIMGDRRIEHRGEYTEVDRPRRLSFTWDADHFDRPTTVTVELTPVEGGTDLRLIHDGLPDEESVESHTGGWNDIVEKLDADLG